MKTCKRSFITSLNESQHHVPAYLCCMNQDLKHPVILFDGLCNLCEGSVQFVLRHDKKKQFVFASLQSRVAEKLLLPFTENLAKPDSFLLLENGHMYTRSTAALRVCRRLNGFFPLLYGFIIIPRFIRDAVYKLIAANRYKWFGKKEACWIPTPELSARFLDQDDLRSTGSHA